MQDNQVTLTIVDRKHIILPMITEKKLGRPFGNTELALKVKRLKDVENLTLRKISLVIERDVSYVHRLYRRKLPLKID